MSELQLDVSHILRNQLEDELEKLKSEESVIDIQLKDYFCNLSGSQLQQSHSQQQPQLKKSMQLHTPPILLSIKKIEDFSPCFEAISQDTKKLSNQIGECRTLSEQMSKIVKRLDNMQIRAQLALACTEDIINLKDCKMKLASAIQERDLPLAVNYLRQFHDIDEEAAKASDDIVALQQAERELKELVNIEFNNAISESNIERVMALCPLLQTLGLQTEARDTFLNFMESSIFIAVSADIAANPTNTMSPPENSVDTYIQSLSGVFNSSYLIFQNYLPIIIKGMEASYGDVYFIRKLHNHCEKQSAVVLKRYVKFRNLKQVIQSLSVSSNNVTSTPADLHMILDELTLLLQYCCVYSKYLSQLCQGAESRNRFQISKYSQSMENETVNIAIKDENSIVFKTTTEFSHMIEELVDRYYLEGEFYLMKQTVKSTNSRLSELTNMNNITSKSSYSTGLDECFFVLRRCGQRALMTNNIHASCAVLRVITDLIITELHVGVSKVLDNALSKIISIIKTYLTGFLNSAKNNNGESFINDGQSSVDSNAMGSDFNSVVNVLGLKNAMSLVTIRNTQNDQSSFGNASSNRLSKNDDNDEFDDDDQEPDIWGVANYKKLILVTELCIRYSEQLSKEITNTGANIYGINTVSASSSSVKPLTNNSRERAVSSAGNASTRDITSSASIVSVLTSEAEKLKMCIDDLNNAKKLFSQLLKTSTDRISAVTTGFIREIITLALDRNGGLNGWGIRFDTKDDDFEKQESVNYLPTSLISSLEFAINISTSHLSETCKDMIVSSIADTCCEKLESFISLTQFCFTGALKMEEISRAMISMLSKHSTISIRNKFSRLREINNVLTADYTSQSNILMDSYTHLTTNEVLAFASLRIEKQNV